MRTIAIQCRYRLGETNSEAQNTNYKKFYFKLEQVFLVFMAN